MIIKYLILMGTSLAIFSCANANAEAATSQRLEISSDFVDMVITPNAGGRVIHFSAAGKKNVLLVGKDILEQPQPTISYFGQHIDYFGHIVWLGPQNSWWTYQTKNQQRREARAPWPPDPYIVLAENKVLKSNDKQITLQGIDSPISGVRLSKSFTLTPNKQQVELLAAAQNIQAGSISRDIWFNTRVASDAVIYVAVDSTDNIRFDGSNDPLKSYPVYSLENGFLQLKNPNIFADNIKRRSGKLFIQPTAGWIAAFVNQQLFVIEFKLNAQSSIHPEQGQIELYYNFDGLGAAAGLIELEVHSPYQSFVAGESISAKEWWSIYPYAGPNARSAQLAYLQQKLNTADVH
ncbi:DUF4380 domain-containing protein [Alteromonadaceae bacterium BrNp21-10]|nr:DUF4380 domain-containing protein [Alteromonadaceae bacterium BrNp21-10]